VPEEQAKDEAYWEGLEQLLRDAFAGRADLAALVARARERIPYRAPRRAAAPGAAPPPTVVKISNKLSDRYTVVDVGTEDRIGLLHDLSRRISELGLDIHYAKISTRGTRAADVFYVTKDGSKVEDPTLLAAIQAALAAV
jgi:[protein-PII] uridylyltransferase